MALANLYSYFHANSTILDNLLFYKEFVEMVGMNFSGNLGFFCHFGKNFTNLAKNGVGEDYWT
jgi:hypothetical protein